MARTRPGAGTRAAAPAPDAGGVHADAAAGQNLLLTTHRSYLRKALEYTLTPCAELVLGKQRILELYLNVVEWGPGVYGAEAAARAYYQTSAAALTREQAARLAAVLPAPRTRTPQRMDTASARILTRMRQMGW